MKGHDAVSPVIGTLLVLAIFTVSAATVVGLVRPQIIDYQERGKVDSVVTHMSAAAAEMRQLAISGNPSQISQPIIDLPGGTFQLDAGHLVALGVGIHSNASADSVAVRKAIGNYARFIIGPGDLTGFGGPNYGPSVDRTDRAVSVTFRHDAYTGSNYNFDHRVAYWDGEQWVATNSGIHAIQSGTVFQVALQGPPSAPTAALQDRMWRIEYYNTTPDPAELVGQTYLYDQTGMTYRFDGESGPRNVYGENGAVFRSHDGRMQLVTRSLISPPASDYGNSLFTLRNLRMDAIGGSSGGGNVDIGLLMRVTNSEAFIFDAGASHVRFQFWGTHPSAWENHLLQEGFTLDTPANSGVFWGLQKIAGNHDSFPVNMIDTEVDVRVQSV